VRKAGRGGREGQEKETTKARRQRTSASDEWTLIRGTASFLDRHISNELNSSNSNSSGPGTRTGTGSMNLMNDATMCGHRKCASACY